MSSSWKRARQYFSVFSLRPCRTRRQTSAAAAVSALRCRLWRSAGALIFGPVVRACLGTHPKEVDQLEMVVEVGIGALLGVGQRVGLDGEATPQGVVPLLAVEREDRFETVVVVRILVVEQHRLLDLIDGDAGGRVDLTKVLRVSHALERLDDLFLSDGQRLHLVLHNRLEDRHILRAPLLAVEHQPVDDGHDVPRLEQLVRLHVVDDDLLEQLAHPPVEAHAVDLDLREVVELLEEEVERALVGELLPILVVVPHDVVQHPVCVHTRGSMLNAVERPAQRAPSAPSRACVFERQAAAYSTPG
jgi:hypothetical protein